MSHKTHKYDLEPHRWFKLEMARCDDFPKNAILDQEWIGIILDGHVQKNHLGTIRGQKTYNVLGRCNTIREYWAADHAMRLLKKQFPFAYITNESRALDIHYTGLM